MMAPTMRWLRSRLSRKFLLGTAGGLVASSLVFLLLFLVLLRTQMEAERTDAATQLNRLLQASLENAMLKNDLDGLRGIVHALGQQPDIVTVMILDPAGEVRFSSRSELLGKRYRKYQDKGCSGCHEGQAEYVKTSLLLTDNDGVPVLRSVNPVANREPCTTCHGPLAENPINGILFVDYNAAPIVEQARTTGVLFIGAGLVVLLITLSGGWWFMNRFVLRPVGRLDAASQSLAAGDLEARVPVSGDDELAGLGERFNGMAERIQQTLRALKEQEQFLEQLVDAVPDGLRVIDEDYREVLTNRAYLEQLGKPADSASGSTCHLAAHGLEQPCPQPLVTCPLAEVQRHGEPLKTIHRHRRQDGSTLDVEVYAAPMRITRGGRPHALVVESIRDLEQDVRFSHEQRLSELGRLAAGVAHEIHNPLASMRLSLEALARGVDGREPTDKELEYLRLIEDEVDACLAITERMLRLSAYGGNRKNIVDVNQAVSDVVQLAGWEADEQGISVTRSLAPGTVRILGDDSELRMTILNLLQNAFHAIEGRGDVSVVTERSGGQVLISVTDTGTGIPPEVRPHIFSPFFSRRADGLRGTGLGLSISWANVERCGGTIEVESSPGKGTRFTVRLPDPDQEDAEPQ